MLTKQIYIEKKNKKDKFKSLVFGQYFGQKVFYASCSATFRYFDFAFNTSHNSYNIKFCNRKYYVKYMYQTFPKDTTLFSKFAKLHTT